MQELADGSILVAEPPALVDDDAHKNQHHHDEGGCQCYGEDDALCHPFKTLCQFSKNSIRRCATA